MGVKPRKSKKRSSTSADYKRQLRRTTFFLDRSLSGAVIAEELRRNGVKIEPHHVWFRHNTEDVDWLPVVGEKKWAVLTADISIGRRPLELEALLAAGVRAFVPTRSQLTGIEIAKVFLEAMPQILQMLDDKRFPFIAKIYDDGSVNLWKTDVEFPKGQQGKLRYRPRKVSKG